MKIEFAENNIVRIDDARIVFRNFAGRVSQYNREGERNFAVVIPNQDIAEKLSDAGYNVKIRPAKEEGDNPFMYLKVKVSYKGRPPRIYLQSGSSRNTLDEESIDCLDDIDISSVDMDLRPYEWHVNGNDGLTVYLQSLLVRQETDRFQERFAEEEYPEE